MKVAFITGSEDPASLSIWGSLKERINHEHVHHHHEGDLITFESADEIDADILVFLSKHQSKSGKRSLSVHPVGNFAKAEFGGRDCELALCDAFLMQKILHALSVERDARDIDYDVIYEATHHGPFTSKPSLFVEIGSDMEAWTDPRAAEAVAAAIARALDDQAQLPVAIGLGGLHTVPNFTKIALRAQVAFGHMCPTYRLKDLNCDLLMQMIDRTHPRPHMVVLDYKSLKEHKQDVRELALSCGLEVCRTKDF